MAESDDKLWSGLSYVGWICCLIPSVIIFLLKKDESEHIKFHSLQSIIVGLLLTAVGIAFSIVTGMLTAIIPFMALPAMLVGFALNLFFLGYWIYLMFQAFTGNDIEIPYVSDLIRSNLM